MLGLNLLKVVVVSDVDLCGNIFPIAFLSTLLDFFPIVPIVLMHRLLTEDPRTIDSGILLEAIVICPVVDTNDFPVTFLAHLANIQKLL